MKKITKAILTGAVIAGMFMAGGCGNSSSGSSLPKTNESALMQKIKSSGKLTVGTASGFPPYEFLDTSASDGKKIDGIDIKLAEAVAKKLGVKLEIQDMTFQSLLSSLTTGKVDIAV
ncbi:transporter substrate-binding domain-containing protein, partial [Dialister hominis]|uniref:transporter substrate-binding domain-containing protein n=2 Tax=Dialister TaxID=39948 RepID=UPI003079F700